MSNEMLNLNQPLSAPNVDEGLGGASLGPIFDKVSVFVVTDPMGQDSIENAAIELTNRSQLNELKNSGKIVVCKCGNDLIVFLGVRNSLHFNINSVGVSSLSMQNLLKDSPIPLGGGQYKITASTFSIDDTSLRFGSIDPRVVSIVLATLNSLKEG